MVLVLAILAYLLGALPLGYWAIRCLTGQDPRLASAYNLGLENTLERLGPGPVLLAWGLDFLKGLLAVWMGGQFGLSWAVIFAFLVYLGHLYPPRFFAQGNLLRGRGAGVLVGAVLGLYLSGLSYLLTLVVLLVAALGLVLSRYASLAALTIPGTLALLLSLEPITGWARLAAWGLFLAALWRYKENIGRMLEGTEPRLGEPPPLPSDKQVVCAFMIHPLTVDDLFQSPRFRWARPLVERGLISQSLVENLAEAIRPMKVGELRGVKTADGREIRCHLISAPLLPHQITGKPELATQRAIQGARLAKELGCTVVGLGAFWSVVGEKGRIVQEAVPEIEVTNGGAYTAGTVKAAIPGILAHFEQSGRRLQEATAAVVGANGVVAFGIARQIAPLVGRLILVGRNQERLEKSAASLKQNLERKGQPVPQLIVSTDISAIREADLIFTATSDPRPVIFPQHVKPGAWIYDEGVPPDVDDSVKQVPGVRVIPGGVVRPPGAMTGNLDLHFGEGAVPACLAETMILAAEKAYERKSLGGETKSENIQFFVERAEALGFRVVD
ncbi:glycerol-3-phosphate acyltransferase [Meiothermus taiwanensis]|uniref:Glycerol-3-phosphate acyltransferase n=1 Tax=Meiothermus taiwanensis TaxID=172827 RepID=A0A399E0P1_9DEIN|nr:glycerol-3-phosphate acyltransferase [Meiothermus taiwanensis]KZK16791.1 dehydrogenase [Meiothermus taiwanensis]RIH78214.1 Long-chain acyl-[acyl-carrier-protein] reductase [Meiothermus taiwanensis]